METIGATAGPLHFDFHPAWRADPAPALVFIPGGSFERCRRPPLDFAHFAHRYGISVIVVQYRVGIYASAEVGHLDATLAGSSANAVRDTLTAVEQIMGWAPQLGIDPHRVAIGGHSAGAVIAAAIMASPLRPALLRRFIIQSGSGDAFRPNPTSERFPTESSIDLLSATHDQLTAHQRSRRQPLADIIDSVQPLDLGPATKPHRPALDSQLLPATPTQHLEVEPGELLVGSVRDECRAFTHQYERPDVRTALRELAARSNTTDRYPSNHNGRTKLLTDLLFTIPTQRLAHTAALAGRTVFHYRTDIGLPPIGPVHGTDLPLIFNPRPARRHTPLPEAWARFITNGHPGPAWAPTTVATPTLNVITRTVTPTTPPIQHWS